MHLHRLAEGFPVDERKTKAVIFLLPAGHNCGRKLADHLEPAMSISVDLFHRNRSESSVVDRLGQFWQAEAGNFSRAPKEHRAYTASGG